jgi:hypothetical protein
MIIIGRRTGIRSRATKQLSVVPIVKDESIQFLLAEFAALRELREVGFSIIERRVQFIATLQAAEVAFVGVLVSRATDNRLVAAVALVLGLPTILLTYIAYERALDFQIQGRKYIRAMNAIRGFFVENDPAIRPAIHLPVDPTYPRLSSIGHGGSVLQSFAVMVLILTVFLTGILGFAGCWLASTFLTRFSSETKVVLAAAAAAGLCCCLTVVEVHRIRRRLREVEVREQTPLPTDRG